MFSYCSCSVSRFQIWQNHHPGLLDQLSWCTQPSPINLLHQTTATYLKHSCLNFFFHGTKFLEHVSSMLSKHYLIFTINNTVKKLLTHQTKVFQLYLQGKLSENPTLTPRVIFSKLNMELWTVCKVTTLTTAWPSSVRIHWSFLQK